MISIECHRSGERCPGKREFDNRIEINRVRSGGQVRNVAIPFKQVLCLSALFVSCSLYWRSVCRQGPGILPGILSRLLLPTIKGK